jgi:spore maturation protein CgeB
VSVWLRRNLEIAGILPPGARASLDAAARHVGYSVVTSRSGDPVLEWNGRALDSRRDPAAAARSAAAEVSTSPVVVIGLGGGYLVEALLDRGIAVAGVVDTTDALAAALASRDLGRVLERAHLVAADAPGAQAALARLRSETRHTVVHAPRVQMHGALAGLAQAWETMVAARAPRVVVAGPPLGGSLGVAHSVAAAAGALGADVRFVDAGVFGGAHEAFGAMPVDRAQRVALQGHFALLMGEAIVEVARACSADLVLALAQAPLSEPALTRLRQLGIRTAFWFVENTRVLPYWRDVARHYDAFFAIQNGRVLEQIAEAGAASAHYLPMACDPARHHPVTLGAEERKRYGAAISFAGAPYLNRRHVLGGVRDLGLRVWGDGWESTVLAACVGEAGRFDTATLRKVVAATAVNLNLHSAEHVAGLDPQPDYVNPRTFEIAACGGFQLVDRRDPLPTLFAGDEMATFESVAHLRDRATHFLRHPEEAAAMAVKARARTLSEHTYEHRVLALFERVLPVHLQGSPARESACGSPRQDAARADVPLRQVGSIEDAIERAGTRPTLDADEALLRVILAVRKEAVGR